VLAIISVLAMQGSWLSYPWHQSDSDRRQRVIPGAKQKGISATATVPAAASVSATPQHAVVLLFVNQSTTIGGSPPTTTTSSVKVTLEHVGSRWLVSDFIPV
jgi:Mce-associated membrane protein